MLAPRPRALLRVGARPARSALCLLALLGGLPAVTSAPAGASPTRPSSSARRSTGSFSCDSVGKGMVNGTPDLAPSAVPAIRSVELVPSLGGLLVVYKFKRGFQLAPEGVYFSWTVYIYRHRADADHPLRTVELQVEDRGLGWQPTGWSLLASTYYSSSPVAGAVHTDPARDTIATFFPGGFVDLRPPFYWYASQEVFRSYLPRKSKLPHQDWAVNGSIVNDCPGGVLADAYSLPEPAKLLSAT